MAYKNQGPDVSENPTAVAAGGGQYTGDEHSFESMVFRQDKPVLDWELNLLQEILGQNGTRLLALRTVPSCFLTGDFLERPDLGDGTDGSYEFLPAVAGNENRFRVRAANLSVNGWPVRFEYSDTADPGFNDVILPDPPLGGIEINLVILEFWRALVLPSPSTANKSPTGQILRNGNARAGDSFPPGNVNLADDLVDPSYAQPTQARVQIQYRYRVVQNVDVTSPTFLDGPQTTANTVPYKNLTGVDGDTTGYTYAPQASSTGLWRSGTGDAAAAGVLGTVDGFMYALPLCAVVRRNTSAFDESANRNGAPLIGAATNPRPDGLYADQIVADDVKDMRHGVAWDLEEVLAKNVQYLLDNSLISEVELFADGASTVGGNAFTVGDDVSPSGALGDADGIRVRFSGRPVTESCVHRVSVSGATTLTINSNAIATPWGDTLNIPLNSPTGTALSGVLRVRNETGTASVDLMASASNPRVRKLVVTDTSVSIEFTGAVTGDVHVELLVSYPGGHGVRRNVVEEVEAWFPAPAVIAAWVNASAFVQGDNPAGRYSLPGPASGTPATGKFWWMDPSHRELTAYVPAQNVTTTYFANASGQVLIPGLASAATSNTAPYAVSALDYSGSYTIVSFTPAPPSGTGVSVTYSPFRPIPKISGGDPVTVWYKTRAVQALMPAAGEQTLRLIPRCVSKVMHVVTAGPGSPDSPFPFDSPGAQIPLTATTGQMEATMDAPSAISVAGFGINSGYIQVPTYVPYAPNPSQVTLYRNALDSVTDGDGRGYWPKSDDGSAPAYSPTAFGAPLASAVRHKVALPAVCELKDDVPGIGVRGTLVLVVFCRTVQFGAENSVTMSSAVSDSGAAVYRLRGGFLSPRKNDR